MKRKTLTNVADPKQTMKELGITHIIDKIVFMTFICGYIEGAYDYTCKKVSEKEALTLFEDSELMHNAVLKADKDLKEVNEEEIEETSE